MWPFLNLPKICSGQEFGAMYVIILTLIKNITNKSYGVRGLMNFYLQ